MGAESSSPYAWWFFIQTSDSLLCLTFPLESAESNHYSSKSGLCPAGGNSSQELGDHTCHLFNVKWGNQDQWDRGRSYDRYCFPAPMLASKQTAGRTVLLDLLFLYLAFCLLTSILCPTRMPGTCKPPFQVQGHVILPLAHVSSLK